MSGRHFTLDGWARRDGRPCPRAMARLRDADALAALLDDIVVLVGMRVLESPRMLTVPDAPELVDGKRDCGGTTGVVILTTSHASLHTWPLRGHVSMDLYSCLPFDGAPVLALVAERLHLTGGEWRCFERSLPPDGPPGFVRC